MLVLDTNVVAELLRPAPARAVVGWLAAQDGAAVYVTAITEAELRAAVACLPGARAAVLAGVIDGILQEDFGGRILAFDSLVAAACAEITAARRRAGRPIGQVDAQIAAICRTSGAALATRNVQDFDGCGLRVVNPWEG